MKSFNGFFCALLGAAIIGPAAVQADDKPATNAPAGTNAAPTMKLDDLLPDVTVARGKGFEIKRSQLDQTIVSIRSSIAAQGKSITAEQMPIVEVQCLDRLILVQILNGMANDAEKAKGKAEADKRLEVFQRRGDVLQRQLKALGMTQESLYKNWSQEATFQEVLRDKITVTDDQVKKFYDDNPDRFQQPELVRASHILFLTTDPKTGMPISDDEKQAKRKKADGIAKRAQAGEADHRVDHAGQLEPGHLAPRGHGRQGDGDDEREHPERLDQRQRPEVSQKTLLPRRCSDAAGNISPWNPGAPVEPRCQLELPRHPPRQHHRLKRIQQHHANDDDAENSCRNAGVKSHAGFLTAKT